MATCNTNALLSNAACFTCLPPGFRQQLKLVMLARWLAGAGGADYLNPFGPGVSGLIANAQCFTCLNPGQWQLIKLVLLCRILTGNLEFGVNPSASTSYGDDILIL